jgi:NAD(P)-dependent dehydrogenase (short-subunit alcohol dehydrogenase family)
MNRLTTKAVIIMGSGSGIGAATLRLFARNDGKRLITRTGRQQCGRG